MEITLTKIKTFTLEPFGNFCFKWKKPKNPKPNKIWIGELTINHDAGMPMTPEQEKMVVYLMKKNKTNVLTDGNIYYTRAGHNLVEIKHGFFDQTMSNIRTMNLFAK